MTVRFFPEKNKKIKRITFFEFTAINNPRNILKVYFTVPIAQSNRGCASWLNERPNTVQSRINFIENCLLSIIHELMISWAWQTFVSLKCIILWRSTKNSPFPPLPVSKREIPTVCRELTSRLTDELFWLKLAHDWSCAIGSDNERFFTDNPNPPRHYFI